MAAEVRHHWEWEQSVLKSGKPGKRWISVGPFEFCPVVTCEWCGRLGSPVWVKAWYIRPWRRFDLRGHDASFEPEPKVCMGCMARARGDWQTQRILQENQRIINTIKREASRVNAENRRRAALVPG